MLLLSNFVSHRITLMQQTCDFYLSTTISITLIIKQLSHSSCTYHATETFHSYLTSNINQTRYWVIHKKAITFNAQVQIFKFTLILDGRATWTPTLMLITSTCYWSVLSLSMWNLSKNAYAESKKTGNSIGKVFCLCALAGVLRAFLNWRNKSKRVFKGHIKVFVFR